MFAILGWAKDVDGDMFSSGQRQHQCHVHGVDSRQRNDLSNDGEAVSFAKLVDDGGVGKCCFLVSWLVEGSTAARLSAQDVEKLAESCVTDSLMKLS